MPDPWMPGLNHDPGRGAGYNAGKNRMYMAVEHDTQGTDSYNICKWGRDGYNASLCNILLPKEGVPWQFCEIDAIAYHAGSAQYGDYNPFGPGFEIERLPGEGVSPDQMMWMGRIILWLEAEWGLPAVHYWGPQFPWWGADFHGHVNHRDIHPNPDGITEIEWNRCLAAAGASQQEGFLMGLNDAEQQEILDFVRLMREGAPQFGVPKLLPTIASIDKNVGPSGVNGVEPTTLAGSRNRNLLFKIGKKLGLSDADLK